MAEKDPLDRLGEELQCAVCLDTYTDPKCNHTYCKGYIEQLVVRNGHSVSCLNCRKVTPIPENGVQGLQPAFRIKNLLEIQDSLKKKVEGASGPASYCPDHNEEELKLYCETCSKLICFECVITGSNHHKCNYQKLNKLCGHYQKDIMTSLEPLKENLATIGKASGNLEICREEIYHQRATAITSIEKTIKQLHETLELGQRRLVSQVQQVANNKLEQLASQDDRIRAMQAPLEQCQASVEEKLQTCSEEELVMTKTDVVGQIEEVNSSFNPDILKPSTEADIRFIAPADIICNYGSLSAGELLPDPTQYYATGPVWRLHWWGKRLT